MRKSLGILAIALIIAAFSIAVSYTIAQDAPKDETKPEVEKTVENKDSMNVAYVNMLEIIKEYFVWKEELEALKEQKEEYQKQLTENEKELMILYNQLQESSEPNPDKFTQWKKLKQLFEYQKKLWEMNLQNQFRKMFKEIYNEVYAAIIEYSNLHKYDLVLGISEQKINVGTEAEFLQKVTLRTVIVYPKQNDITKEIITKLNPKVEEPKEKPAETPEKPAETPEKPVETPEKPAETPEKPAETPEKPAETPEKPAETPEKPVETPEKPAETPEKPVETPEKPAETPEKPTTDE
ncbi:MAG: OmpH family outer membrane protein [Planctomycetes bacterium]|nr:OmpH family outer membrane protein [Planctomycetota bacterium]